MTELIPGFLAGNAAILTNVCLLPLYPGLIAFLAGNAQNERAQRASGWLGLLVLAGVLTLMFVVALALYLASQTFGSILPTLLPLIYGIVIVMGILMLIGFNPFAKLSVAQSPTVRNPYLNAYVYGLLLGPMTLPCTGPVIASAFTLGAVAGTGAFADQVLFFLAFGLGFGWPLVLLPLVARGLQKQFTGWLTRNHTLLTRAAGLLLIAIGLYGYATEVLGVLG
ncbi:MAG: cytochrome c biogenesis protein CcdA [Anaerolineae bacterium]|nr:cytochrome c biogenesis protein CcdA [Anaerolineae bacterium]